MLQKITAGLNAGDKGPAVANLHDVLEKLLQTEVLPIGDAAAQQQMLVELALERASQTYGNGLTLAIKVFQGHRELPKTGRIDQATCDLLNCLLVERGFLEDDSKEKVRGAVRATGGTLTKEISMLQKITAGLKPGDKGNAVANLHDALQKLLESEVLSAEYEAGRHKVLADLAAERATQLYGETAASAIKGFQSDHGLPETGEVDQATADLLNSLLTERGFVKPEPTGKVEGVVRAADGTPAAGLQVKAFDRDLVVETPLGEAITDATGHYSITYTAAKFRGETEQSGPEVHIRVLDAAGHQLIESRIISDASHELNLDLTLPEPPSTRFVVRGRVTDSEGKPAGAIEVKAFDRNVGVDDKLIGEKTTDADGCYVIAYSLGQLDGKQAADLVIEGYDEGKRIVQSDVIFDARPDETKDLSLPEKRVATKPEFDRLVHEIRPLLRNGLELHALQGDQVAFLSGKTRIESKKIEQIAQARRLAGADSVLAPLYYGLLSRDMPTDPSALLARGKESIGRALEMAEAQGAIGNVASQDIDRFVDEVLPRLRADELLRPAVPGKRPSLGDVLGTVPSAHLAALSEDIKRGIANLVGDSLAVAKDLPERLTALGLETGQARAVERSLRLGELTRRNIPLMRNLVEEQYGPTSDEASLRPLAHLGRDRWLDLAYAHGVPPETNLGPDRYGLQLERTVEAAHPTAVLAERIKAGELVFDHPDFEEIGTALESNPDFDLLDSDLRTLPDDLKLEGIRNRDKVSRSLRKIQRMKRLSADWRETGALINAGVSSAHDIVHLGPERLGDRMAAQMDTSRVGAIYDNAKMLQDIGLTVLVNAHPRFSPTAVAAIPMSGAKARTSNDPNLQALFGPLDYCECAHDQSVLSPSAYYVDLLRFIDPNRPPRPGRPIEKQVAWVSSFFSFEIPADAFRDADVGDVLSYSLSSAPVWLKLNVATRILSGIPVLADVGVHAVTVRGTDESGAYAEVTFSVEVKESISLLLLCPTKVYGQFEVKAEFGCPVQGLTLDEIQVTGGRASHLSGTGATRTFKVTPEKEYVFIQIPAGAAQDAAGTVNAYATRFVLYPGGEDMESPVAARMQAVGGSPTVESPIEALQARRPDLLDLELSRENTQVELPHIDLAMEILENAVALPLEVALPAGFDAVAALSASALESEERLPLPPQIVEVLKTTAVDVGNDLLVRRVENRDGESVWTVRDRTRQWTLVHRPRASVVLVSALQLGRSSVTGIDPQRLRDELTAGYLSAESIGRIDAIRSSPGDWPSVLRIVDCEILPRKQNEWNLVYRLGVVVNIMAEDGQRALTLQTPDGNELVTKAYSPEALSAITEGLGRGVIAGPLQAHLPHASVPYRVTELDTGKSWVIVTPDRTHDILADDREHLTITALTYQSPADSRDRGPAAQNHNPAAYERLRAAVFPWSLPFDLPLETVRICLERAGTSRRELIELLDPESRLTDPRVMQELLRLTPAEALIVQAKENLISPSSYALLWKYWGLEPGPGGMVEVFDASEGKRLDATTPLEALSKVSILIQQARISVEELQEVIHTSFVKAAGPLEITPPDECCPSKLKLDDLQGKHLERMHRFIRLWRRLGWTITELDFAIDVLTTSPSGISADFLLRLAQVKRLQHLLNMPVETLISWYGARSFHYRPYAASPEAHQNTLYERIFLNPLAQNPPEPAFLLDPVTQNLGPDADEKSISEKAPAIAAALGIRQADLIQCVPEDRLSLDNLYRLYRYFSLMRGLGLSVEDFFALLRISGCEPFMDPAATIDLCESLAFVRSSGFTIEELEYLLRHDIRYGSALPLSDARRGEIADAVRSALKARLLETASHTEEALRKSDDKATRALADLPPWDDARVIAVLAPDFDPDLNLRAHLGDLVIEHVANSFALEQPVARLLLVSEPPVSAVLSHPAYADKDALEVFLDPAFIVESSGGGQSTSIDAVLIRLHKAALLVSRLAISVEQLAWVANPRSGSKGMSALELDSLPADPFSGEPAGFGAWKQAVTLFQLPERARGMKALLAQYVAAVQSDDAIIAIRRASDAISTALFLADYLVRAAAEKLEIASLENYRDPLNLARWLNLLIAAKKLGANLPQMDLLTQAEWSDTTQSLDAIATARGLLRSKYGADSWRDVLKPIADKLRVRQRDALVDYLVAQNGWRDANDVYEHYLIDPQMSPVVMTTRMVQATASVQQFIQRCLLNLEDTKLDSTQRKRWEWMKNYRVWEANRKVFLYPENWLHPELRDDKTRLFRSLESELANGEPSYELGKDSLVGYLQELTDEAIIRVLGMYESADENRSARTLYVVGRSPHPPGQHYWRKCHAFGEATMRWSGWERIDLDISGDHVMPFTLNGDLYMAWLIIRETRTATVTADASWEAQLAWARKISKGWSKKNVSRANEALKLRPLGNISIERGVAVRPETVAGGMRFHLFAAVETQAFISLPKWTPSTKTTGVLFEDGVAVGFYAEVTGTVYRVLAEGEIPVPKAGATMKSYSHWRYASGKLVRMKVHGVIPMWNQETEAFDLEDCDFGVTISRVDKFGRFKCRNEYRYLDIRPTLINFAAQSASPFTQIEVSILAENYFDTHLDVDPFVGTRDVTILGKSVKCCAVGGDIIVGLSADKATEYSPDRDVTLNHRGYFEFSPYKDVETIDLSDDGPSLTQELEADVFRARPYAGGFLEGGSEAPLSLPTPSTGQTSVFEYTPGTFFVVPAFNPALTPWPDPDTIAAPSIWHYKDDVTTAYFGVEGNPLGEGDLAVVDSTATTAKVLRDTFPDLDGLFSPSVESRTDSGHTFDAHMPMKRWLPSTKITEDAITFDLRAPSSLYNWEIFLHAPLLIAEFLTNQQRFQDARRWLHFVFDPTATNNWRFRPFCEAGESVRDLLRQLAKSKVGEEDWEDRPEFVSLIESWKDNPFRPHAVARSRLRQTAYQWRALFNYLDMLICWGDQLFRRDTRESINEAIQLYVLAAKLLGRRPQAIKRAKTPEPATYLALRRRWDDFGNAWMTDIAVAYRLLNLNRPESLHPREAKETGAVSSLSMLYFCIPHNEKLLEYWDKVDERLFNIRHSRNIDGVERSLALWEPPIDPDLLVRATAAGLDLSEALSEMAAPRLPYRFQVLVQKAAEVCNEVKALGASLLSALEKKDAEDLALRRSGQEIAILNLIKVVKTQQIEEVKANITALKQSQSIALERFNQYQKLSGATSSSIGPDGVPVLGVSSSLQVAAGGEGEVAALGLLRDEVAQMDSMASANKNSRLAGAISTIASVLHAIPDLQTGSGAPAHSTAKFGGSHLGSAANAYVAMYNTIASGDSHKANKHALIAQYQRRHDEWVHQSKLAVEELRHINKQIAANDIRQAIAERELESHEKQIENAKAIDEFMHDKYTNQELYSWMAGEISGVYFKSYKLAYDLAKRAERAFGEELGIDNPEYVKFGYWDSLKKGLLAGENLSLAIKRLEVGYLEKHKRQFELTKHVSLRQLSPEALLSLRATGKCSVQIPEWLYDLDCPGHYMRRIKSVAVSIPCVAGPYTGVHCTLTLEKSYVRKKSLLKDDKYLRNPETEDDRFDIYTGPVQSIVTSTGNNDSGLFETNLRDERYLPFEGSGAESHWNIELPTSFPAFDYGTISDVVLHIRYTATRGVDVGKVTKALQELFGAKQAAVPPGTPAPPAPLFNLFSLRGDFPTEWSSFVNGEALKIRVRKEHFPYFVCNSLGKIESLTLFGNQLSEEVLPIRPVATVTLPIAFGEGLEIELPTTDGDDPILTRTAKDAFLVIGYSLNLPTPTQ